MGRVAPGDVERRRRAGAGPGTLAAGLLSAGPRSISFACQPRAQPEKRGVTWPRERALRPPPESSFARRWSKSERGEAPLDRSRQAIAIGLSKARRAGVPLKPPPAKRGRTSGRRRAAAKSRAPKAASQPGGDGVPRAHVEARHRRASKGRKTRSTRGKRAGRRADSAPADSRRVSLSFVERAHCGRFGTERYIAAKLRWRGSPQQPVRGFRVRFEEPAVGGGAKGESGWSAPSTRHVTPAWRGSSRRRSGGSG